VIVCVMKLATRAAGLRTEDADGVVFSSSVAGNSARLRARHSPGAQRQLVVYDVGKCFSGLGGSRVDKQPKDQQQPFCGPAGLPFDKFWLLFSVSVSGR